MFFELHLHYPRDRSSPARISHSQAACIRIPKSSISKYF